MKEVMRDFKIQLELGKIQKAYRHIFDIMSELNKALKDEGYKTSVLYHGYLDMTYLPVFSNVLKENGLKLAVIFDYSAFRFEIWLSAINRKKRDDVLKIMTDNNWDKFSMSDDSNLDAIIELKLDFISDFISIENVVTSLLYEVNEFNKYLKVFIENNKEAL